MEVWRDIKGYEGLYQVSSLGRVKSLDRIDSIGRRRKEIILKQSKNTVGYLVVSLYSNSKKTKQVHVLVSVSFLGHTSNGMNVVVDHLDNNKLNNDRNNLQLTTNRKNCSKDRKNKTSKYTGVSWNKKRSKWVAQIYLLGKKKYLGSFTSETDASNTYQKTLKENNNE